MFGPMYQQMMKSRLGVGKPLEGYGGFSQQGGVTPPPTPWGPQDGASLPAPSPWLHQGGPRTTPYGPRPEGGAMGENPWNPRSTPFEDRPQGGETRMGASGVMGGMKNPWQRY